MRALVMKDAYVLWRQMKTFLVILVLLSIVGGVFNSIFVVVWCSMLPFTAIAYDERSHWNQLAAMMPYSRRDLVLSKYVLGWLCMAAAMVFSGVIQAVASALGRGSLDLLTLGLSFLGGMISLAITLPVVLRFGVEKGRMGFLVIVFGVALLAGFIADSAEKLPGLRLPAMALLPVAAIAATAISIPLSMKLYQVN